MDTLFITGFEDFLEPPSIGRLPNTSRLLIDYIESTPGLEEELLALSGFKSVRTLVRPVPRQAKLNKFRNKSRQSIRRILAQMDERDAIISFGQGRMSQTGPILESRFINALSDGPIVDAPINRRKPFTHTNGQEEALNELLVKIQEKHTEVKLGKDAGKFLCNAWGYLSHEAAPGRSLFVHLLGCPTRETAEKLWAAYSDVYRTMGLGSEQEIRCPSVQDNYALLKTLVSSWKPFENSLT